MEEKEKAALEWVRSLAFWRSRKQVERVSLRNVLGLADPAFGQQSGLGDPSGSSFFPCCFINEATKQKSRTSLCLTFPRSFPRPQHFYRGAAGCPVRPTSGLAWWEGQVGVKMGGSSGNEVEKMSRRS